MKIRGVAFVLGLDALTAWPAMAGTDDQKKEQIGAKQATQEGFRFCDLTGQHVEVAKATHSASGLPMSCSWRRAVPVRCRRIPCPVAG
jgi:hypothetical protein